MIYTDMETTEFVELYERTLDDVYRYASRLTGGDQVRTDELVQETYLSVMRRLIRPGPGPAINPTLPYLLVSCRSRFLDGLRAERRRRNREERVANPGTAPSVDTSNIERGEATSALATLPDDQRAALVLRYVDDLTVAEIAHQVDRSVRATESLLVRARTALRTAFHEGTNS